MPALTQFSLVHFEVQFSFSELARPRWGPSWAETSGKSLSPNTYQSVYSRNHPLVAPFPVVTLEWVVLHKAPPYGQSIHLPGRYPQSAWSVCTSEIPSPKSSPVNHANRTQEVCVLSRTSDHGDPTLNHCCKWYPLDILHLLGLLIPSLAAALVHMLSVATYSSLLIGLLVILFTIINIHEKKNSDLIVSGPS